MTVDLAYDLEPGELVDRIKEADALIIKSNTKVSSGSDEVKDRVRLPAGTECRDTNLNH